LLALASGCPDRSDAEPAGDEPETTATAAPSVSPVRSVVTEEPLPESGTYRLHRWTFALASLRIEVADLGFTQTLDAALRQKRAVLAVNAGFFDMAGEPEGLVVVRGRTLSRLAPRLGGGVMTIDEAGRPSLHAAEEFVLAPGTDFAVQCRPRLIVNGQVNIRSDDGKRADRTALCLRDGGSSLQVIVARTDHPNGGGGPTLRAFAERLLHHGCEDALNLDGGPSTGAAFWQDGEVRMLPPRGPVRQALLFHTSR